MKLASLETRFVPVNHRGGWLFVQVRTDGGLVGVGEASHSDDDRRCAAVMNAMGERLRGRELLDIQPRWNELLPLAEGRCGQTALSAIEQALWDLLGQSAGQPVHRLLGGALREKVPLYANINRGNSERSPASFARRAAAAASAGFRAVKLAPFDEVMPRIHGSPEARWAAAQPGLERVAAVRQALGSGTALFVDCHWRFDESTAIRVAGRLAEMDVCWFEDPVPADDFDAYGRVAAAVPMPMAGGETLFGVDAFARLARSQGVRTVMPDVKHCGGISVARSVAAVADAFGVATSLHNPSGPIGTAASLQVSATLANCSYLEYQWDEAPWRMELVEPAETISDGCIEVTGAPGLGVRLNEALLRKLQAAL